MSSNWFSLQMKNPNKSSILKDIPDLSKEKINNEISPVKQYTLNDNKSKERENFDTFSAERKINYDLLEYYKGAEPKKKDNEDKTDQIYYRAENVKIQEKPKVKKDYSDYEKAIYLDKLIYFDKKSDNKPMRNGNQSPELKKNYENVKVEDTKQIKKGFTQEVSPQKNEKKNCEGQAINLKVIGKEIDKLILNEKKENKDINSKKIEPKKKENQNLEKENKIADKEKKNNIIDPKSLDDINESKKSNFQV